ncbi:MAG: hypothetical protein SNH63_02845 [Rikenellaceae bacterium]
MERIIVFLVESIAISALLYGLYVVLFRGKASYIGQRIMLLAIPLVATLSALISIDLIAVPNISLGAYAHVITSTDISVDEKVVPHVISKREVERSISPRDFVIIRGDVHDEPTTWDYLPYVVWSAVTIVMIGLFATKQVILQIATLSKSTHCLLFIGNC